MSFSEDICSRAGIYPYLPEEIIPSVEISTEVSNLFMKVLTQVKRTHPEFSHINIVYTQLTAMQLLQRERLEQHFRCICCELCLKLCKTNSGAILRKYLTNKLWIAIFII